MKCRIIILVFLAMLLAGCGGDVLSPTSISVDSHDRTMETTATMEQSNVRPLCAGLNLTSCNVIQVNDQSAAATVSDGFTLASMCSGGWLLLGCLFLFLAAMMFVPRFDR